MINFIRILIFASILWTALCATNRKKTSDMTNLLLTRINNPGQYNKNIPPVFETKGPVNVSITLFIRSLNFDQKDMKMTTDLTFRMFWKDTRLEYPSSPDVDHVTLLNTDAIWLPDAFFKDSYSTSRQKSVLPETFARITHMGEVAYSARYILHTHCPMDVEYFPHDIQKCPIKIGSYGYTLDDLTLEFKKNVDTEDVKVADHVYEKASNAFTLDSFETFKCASGTTTGTYDCIGIQLNLARITSSYITQWYIPNAVLVVISFFAHLIASEKLLPRIVLSLGPLLTLIAASVSYSANLARVGYTTAIDIYRGFSILVIFLTLLHVCVTYYFASKDQTEESKYGEGRVMVIEADGVFTNIMKSKGDFGSRLLIIGFYIFFIIIYCAVYA